MRNFWWCLLRVVTVWSWSTSKYLNGSSTHAQCIPGWCRCQGRSTSAWLAALAWRHSMCLAGRAPRDLSISKIQTLALSRQAILAGKLSSGISPAVGFFGISRAALKLESLMSNQWNRFPARRDCVCVFRSSFSIFSALFGGSYKKWQCALSFLKLNK